MSGFAVSSLRHTNLHVAQDVALRVLRHGLAPVQAEAPVRQHGLQLTAASDTMGFSRDRCNAHCVSGLGLRHMRKGRCSVRCRNWAARAGHRHLYRCTGTPRMRYQPRPKRVSSRAASNLAPSVGSLNSALVICCDHPNMRMIWVFDKVQAL